MTFFRTHIHIFTSLGTGIFVGIIYWRMTNRILQEIQRLTGSIAQLQAEVLILKDKIETFETRKRNKSGTTGSGFFSLYTSPGDDDEDVYEEAYGGEDDDIDYQKEIEEQIIKAKQLSGTKTEKQEQSSNDGLFPDVDKFFDGTDEDKERAYNMLKDNEGSYSRNAEFYWRFSKSSYQLSQIEGAKGDTTKKKTLVYAAKDLAEKAVQLDDTCANAHKWFAITVGSIGDFESTQDKIKNGFLYKEHIENAIRLQPDDPSNHYLLGRWCYSEHIEKAISLQPGDPSNHYLLGRWCYSEHIEKAIRLQPHDPSNHYLLGRWCYSVYMLSWIERKAAAALFATPPSATIDETLNHFLKADELNPGKWKGNSLFVAKCYIEMRRYKEAKKWLQSAKQIPTISQDDKTSEEEVQTLLTKYGSY